MKDIKNDNMTVKQESGSAPTFEAKDKGQSKQRGTMISLKSVRMLPDVPEEDETVLRHLFRKFSNSWSLFQKHSKLEGKYSVQNLKTLKQKVDKTEALFRS